MLVWILVLYLHGVVANPRTIATLRMLIALLAARWGPLRSAAARAPVSGRGRKGKSGLDVSPATAPGLPARNP
jgi:hypothetical protein